MRNYLKFFWNRWVIIILVILIATGFMTVQFNIDWQGIGGAISEALKAGIALIPPFLGFIKEMIDLALSPEGQPALILLVWTTIAVVVYVYSGQPDEGKKKAGIKIWAARLIGLALAVGFACWINPWFAGVTMQVLTFTTSFFATAYDVVIHNAWAMGIAVGLIFGAIVVFLLRSAGAKVPLLKGAIIIAIAGAIGAPIAIVAAQQLVSLPGIVHEWGKTADP